MPCLSNTSINGGHTCLQNAPCSPSLYLPPPPPAPSLHCSLLFSSSSSSSSSLTKRLFFLDSLALPWLATQMVAEAVGFMMSRPADGGTMPPELVTRDFLGGCQAPAAAAADHPRHDAAAMPGKPPLQKHLSPPPSARGDLNLFPVSGAAAMPPAATMAPAADCAATTTTYHSVCTIEKVKTALERFERGKQGQQQQQHHHHQHSGAGASPSSSSVTTSSVKRRGDVEQGDGCDSPSASATGGMVAAACPRCFLYVLIARSDPRCPRCESHVPPPPAPAPKKKPRIDLNVGFLGT